MPGKKKAKAGTINELQQESLLEAVVIADSFNDNFFPVSSVRPRGLFPVANQPLLSYTLEFLSSCEVKKIYVYCCHFSHQIKEYLQKSKWMKETSPCVVIPIVSADFTSVGDVLRDIEQKALFESDYLLVPGDIISSLHLKDALDEHKDRRMKDKNNPLMTLVMINHKPKHYSQLHEDDVVMVCDRLSNRILRYNKVSENDRTRKYMDIPLNLLKKQSNAVELRNDLIDTGIWICTPQVSQLFTDNFDYQTRDDFIKGILLNEEFLGKQIHMHVARTRYCARVDNFHSYDVVSHDLVSRMVFPFVPEAVFEEPSQSPEGLAEGYSSLRHNVYLHSTCVLGQDSVVLENTVIGDGTKIGKRCRILNSVIGSGCVIGDDCVINGSYIWNKVTVKESCTVNKSLICDDVTIHQSVALNSGCILCDQVSVGPDVMFPADTVVYLVGPKYDEFEDDSEKEAKPFDIEQIGSKGKGYIWHDAEGCEEGSESLMLKRLWGLSLQGRSLEIEREEDDDEDETGSESSSISLSDDDGQEPIVVDDDYTLFQREVKESLQGGFNEKVHCENLILEVNSSKYAYNMTMREIVQAVTNTLFEIASLEDPEASQYFPTLKKVLQYFLPLLLQYNKTASSQLDCLYAIEEYASSHEIVYNCLIKILMFLYENDVLSEQVILLWNAKPKLSHLAIVNPEQIRAKVAKFIQWLQEAEEEDSED